MIALLMSLIDSSRIQYLMINYQQHPFVETEYIAPISQSKNLVKEGKEQRHCITSYH